MAHAYAARASAGRIAGVREAVGIAAYFAEEWQVALAELRASRRINGSQEYLPFMADCERALGRPEKALELYAAPETSGLDIAIRMELLIVAAGARRDMGDLDAAIVMLEVPELRHRRAPDWLARLRYAYADALAAADRLGEARTWFDLAADVDEEGETDAVDRSLELDGVVMDDDDDNVDDEDSDDSDSEDTDFEDADFEDADGEPAAESVVPEDGR